MDNDDRPIGRILSRREVLVLLGASGAALLVGCLPASGSTQQTGSAVPTATAAAEQVGQAAASQTTATCIVRPEVTEGPYFVDERLNRADITSDPSTGMVKEGVPLQLTFNVSQVDRATCSPLAGAIVDIWHCDALGRYSDVSDAGFDTSGEQWLRGYQVTDENGQATFATIFPGWYSGRTVHIHFKIRTGFDEANTYEFTSQLFFDKDFCDTVFAQEPYAAKGEQDTLNSTDSIYQAELLLTASRDDSGQVIAAFDIGLDLSDTETGQPDSNGGPGGRSGGGLPPNQPSGG